MIPPRREERDFGLGLGFEEVKVNLNNVGFRIALSFFTHIENNNIGASLLSADRNSERRDSNNGNHHQED